MLAGYKEIPPKEKKNILYPIAKIKTPLARAAKPVIYADFIASGRPSPLVESYITKEVYTKYSNTHSNSTNGICMKNEIEHVREIVKKEFSVDDSYEILFKGSGCTDCINFLLNCINWREYDHTDIFITTYEHYSNHLPFVELAKNNKHVTLHIIPLTDSAAVDTEWFRRETARAARRGGRGLIITSIIHCSNLTGYFTPVASIKKILAAVRGPQKYFFLDAACSAPYRKIRGGDFDAIFVSPHKYIGGVGTPGLLVARTCLFQKNSPVNPGGSCVKKTAGNKVEYADNIEVRESAGTPAITGILRLGKCFLIKEQYQSIIEHNERILARAAAREADRLALKYGPDFVAAPVPAGADRLPIFAFAYDGLHYNFIVVLLNDLYGIQTRGGKSCDGLFMDYIKKEYDVEGFCRVSLHWTMSAREVKYIFSAIDAVIENGAEYLPQYEYRDAENLWVTRSGASCKAPASKK